MPVYNASRFLIDSVNSILNQTLDDLELICVDDGSTDNSLSILRSFTDPRIKVYSRDHEGGGNARNYGLSKITGKYLYCMDADDILDLNALEDCYKISEEKNLDFVVFKAINYGVEKDHYFETEYQNMSQICNKVKDNVFSYRDLGNLLFDFNVSPWCKFYNSEFVKNTGAKFRENSKFHDNQFFWDIIFKAERIYFIDKFYYTRKRYDESLTASGDIGHINIIGVVNDIIKLFIKHNQLENYKNQLYNLKITWITDRYNQIQNKYKAQFFRKMKNDYLSLKTKEFPNLLDENRRFLYDCVIIAKNYNDFDLIKRHASLNKNKQVIDDLNNQVKDKEKTIQNLENNLKNQEKTNNELNNKINENNTTIQNNQKTIEKLNDTLKSKDNTIDDLNNQINHRNEIIKMNALKISKLEIRTMNLTKRNDYLKNELENKFSFKRLLKK